MQANVAVKTSRILYYRDRGRYHVLEKDKIDV